MNTSDFASLSIRSYTKAMCSHAHDHFQLVLPINGHIEITLDDYSGSVGVGEGICISPTQQHSFRANELSKFVVADMYDVPEQLKNAHNPIFQVDHSLQSFLHFIEVHLSYAERTAQQETSRLFWALLAQAKAGIANDKRITPVLSHIHNDLSEAHTISSLAAIACMGQTQFKVRFKASTGMSLRDYLVHTRMEKARALLRNTDTPIFYVALTTGYDDVTSFSRRFKMTFGQSPGVYKRK
jgi:AraC-like DNA-binding protein